MKFLIIGNHFFEFGVFCRVLINEGHTVSMSNNVQDITDLITDGQITTVIAPMTQFELIKKLISLFPSLHTALVSNQPKDEFHHSTEGYGVLMQLPALPEKSDALALLKKLDRLSAVLTSIQEAVK